MILQITTEQWLLLHDAVCAPLHYESTSTPQQKEELKELLRKTFTEQVLQKEDIK